MKLKLGTELPLWLEGAIVAFWLVLLLLVVWVKPWGMR